MKLFGQTFGAKWIARIRATLEEEKDITRVGLSRRLCERLGGRSAQGQWRDIDARKVLLALEREGLIELPPARAIPGQARVRDEPEDLPETQVTGDLAALGGDYSGAALCVKVVGCAAACGLDDRSLP